VFGISLGIDNVLAVTVIQQWAPPGMLGRVMGLLMLASAGSFPLSAAVAGVLTRHLGPSPVFPIAGALFAVAILAGLTQREFRDFGTTSDQRSLALTVVVAIPGLPMAPTACSSQAKGAISRPLRGVGAELGGRDGA
jgi:MFS family permease